MREDLRIHLGVTRGRRVRFQLDEQWVDAYEGESVAAALWACGIRHLRDSPVRAAPRGVFCAMGVCQECVVLIDGRREASCSYPVSDGLIVHRAETP